MLFAFVDKAPGGDPSAKTCRPPADLPARRVAPMPAHMAMAGRCQDLPRAHPLTCPLADLARQTGHWRAGKPRSYEPYVPKRVGAGFMPAGRG